MKKVIPYNYVEDEKIEDFSKAFKTLFGDSVDILVKNVRVGGDSSIVYVPKKYADKVVTIIVWKDKEKYYEMED